MKDACLFVYGSLRRASATAESRLLAQHAEFVGAAELRAQLFDVGGFPGAVLSEDPAHRVHGELYRIREDGPLFAALDDYEECAPCFPPPHEYVREQHPVMLADGSLMTAWVYLYNRSTVHLSGIESGNHQGAPTG